MDVFVLLKIVEYDYDSTLYKVIKVARTYEGAVAAMYKDGAVKISGNEKYAFGFQFSGKYEIQATTMEDE